MVSEGAKVNFPPTDVGPANHLQENADTSTWVFNYVDGFWDPKLDGE